MKGWLFFCFICISVIPMLADMPGNKPRNPVKVNVEFGDLSGYTIYFQMPYTGDDLILTRDSTFVLSGGHGAPPCYTFFGRNPNSQSTDSLVICNEEQGTVLLKLSVIDGRLVNELTVKNEIGAIINADEPGNTSFFNRKISILASIALASVLLLVAGYFRMQRKGQT